MPRYWLRWRIISATQDLRSSATTFPISVPADRMDHPRAAVPNGTNKDWPQPWPRYGGRVQAVCTWAAIPTEGRRQASMLAADQPGLVDGLLLLSYPLHPPQKPGELRTAHFPRLQTPGALRER